MARINITVYKNSVLATIVSIFGSMFLYFGFLIVIISVISLINGIKEDALGLLLSSVIIIGMGIGLSIAASKISKHVAEKQRQKEIGKMIENDINVTKKI